MNKGTIKILTYTDPNHIFADTALDKNCLHLVPSQEMIQGHRSIGTYGSDPKKGGWQLVPTKKIENAFYGDWFGTARNFDDRKLQQIIEVGNMLAELKPDMTIRIKQADGSDIQMTVDENLIRSLEHNTGALTQSLRLLCELELKPEGFSLDALSTSQLILIYLYQQICENSLTSFQFKRLNSEKEVQEALDKAVEETITKRFPSNKSKQELALAGYKELCSKKTIIFNGVFQLTPTLLSAIFDLKNAGYEVYLIFNYRSEPELRPFYQCWKDIYGLFNTTEFTINNQQHPPVNQDNYKLAIALGSIAAGRYPADCADVLSHSKFYEFASVTEYANFVNHSFEKALRTESTNTNKTYQNTLHYMPEMHYAASRKATNILRAYHPQQFGDRTLLDYPLGKCLTGLVSMWNPEKGVLEIKDFGLLGDCLRGYPAHETDCLTNVNTYNTLRGFFDHMNTIKDVIAFTGQILESKQSHVQDEAFANLSLNQLSEQEISGFYHTLQSISETAKSLFRASDESIKFYERIRYVIDMLAGDHELDEHSRDLYAASLKTLLTRAKDTLEKLSEEQNNSAISSENKQLRMLLDEILKITETDSSSAKWIIHDLVQIDGDILVKPVPDICRINHFGFLSDQDMFGKLDDLFPWPLDVKFFEDICLEDKANTILKLFKQSKLSAARDFPKYALIYGILFSKGPVALSYVRQVGDQQREPFYLFRMLGIKPEFISLESPAKPTDLSPYEYNTDAKPLPFNAKEPADRNPAQICTFRYIIERLIDGKTWYTDRYLIKAYIKTSLISMVLKASELYKDNNFVPKNHKDLDKIVSDATNKIFSENVFANIKSLGFLTNSELHEIRHDVAHQSRIRAYKLVMGICKKIYNSITSENPKQEFMHEPEAQILDKTDVQTITQKVPNKTTNLAPDRSAYLRNAIENYSKFTALYPNDSVFFNHAGKQLNPQQDWDKNDLYNRYAVFNIHKGDYKCSLCACKSFCPYGLTSTN